MFDRWYSEADPAALEGANPPLALPSGSGKQGVQTTSNAGSAMRGSGAGVTAGSGVAVQGEVGDTGRTPTGSPPNTENRRALFLQWGGE